jgi:sugar O-acyltransferase (sialic acid O-acetyltransferase NeuD family)
MGDTQYNKEDAYIVGAGGYAREIASWFPKSNLDGRYALKGYFDDDARALEGFRNAYAIRDGFFNGSGWKGKHLILAIASTQVKEKVHMALRSEGMRLLSLCHDFSIIGDDSDIGEGLTLCPFSAISCNVSVGDCVTVNSGSQIGHDVTIGDYTSLMANVDIGGGASIGKHVFIGSNAVILPGVKIPDHTRIGAGAVVLKSIRQPGTYFGNPAKKIF